MTFTLKQVETFRTVYETESVTAAARRLDVSPATVSATPRLAWAPAPTVSVVHSTSVMGRDCGRRARWRQPVGSGGRDVGSVRPVTGNSRGQGRDSRLPYAV